MGIIGTKAPHLQKEEERKKIIPYDEMYIDIGCSSRHDAASRIELGDQIIFEPRCGHLHGDLFYGKALDNRLGCYAMI